MVVITEDRRLVNKKAVKYFLEQSCINESVEGLYTKVLRGDYVLLAYSGGMLLGVVVCFSHENCEDISIFSVVENYRGRGIGKQMLSKLFEKYPSGKIKICHSDMDFFFEKNGFISQGDGMVFQTITCI